ncbi:MAG: hypothetical protein KKC80_01975, partial [Candidatus Margulisbacteria bacterium]|nr:hypothetical protein [Candidatus Margulisiibacteriota bacterium]
MLILFLLLVVIGLFFWFARAAERPRGTFEGGTKYIYDYVPTVVLTGSWREMGRQYGHFLAPNIRAVY